MDEKADEIIAGWSFGALAANLLPPPFDMMAVSTVFAKMGARLAEIYEVHVSWSVLKTLAKSMVKGVGSVGVASYVGTSLFKYVPGVNLGVALLLQPPIVGAVAYATGNAFKKYFHTVVTGGADLTPDEVRKLAEATLLSKLSS
jgi:uncharacterized protein (DUF697 family)